MVKLQHEIKIVTATTLTDRKCVRRCSGDKWRCTLPQ